MVLYTYTCVHLIAVSRSARTIPLFSHATCTDVHPPTVDQGRRSARSPACLDGILKCNQDFAPRCNELLLIKRETYSRDAMRPSSLSSSFYSIRKSKHAFCRLDWRNCNYLVISHVAFKNLIVLIIIEYDIQEIIHFSNSKIVFLQASRNFLISGNRIDHELIRMMVRWNTSEDEGKKNQSEKAKCFARKYRGPLTGSSHWPSTINYTLYRIRGGPRGGES